MSLISFSNKSLWAVLAAGILSACDGPTGPPGSANITSERFVFGSFSWTDEVLINQNTKVAILEVPEITEDVIDSGMVTVYANLPGTGGNTGLAWTALPYTFRTGASTLHVYGYSIGVGQVKLRFHRTDNVAPGIPSSDFRVVVMPPVGD